MNDQNQICETLPAKSFSHIPVMLKEVTEILRPAIENASNPVFIDMTLGLGSHSLALLQKFPKLRIIGIDRDQSAIDISRQNLAEYSDRFDAHLATFDQYSEILKNLGIEKVDAVLFDLGVSSMQIDDTNRGFSYMRNEKIDMRMDQNSELDAQDILNNYTKDELVCVFRNYGEERYSQQIAAEIVKYREHTEILMTDQLKSIIKSALPAHLKFADLSTQKRIFQSLRIETNDELDILKKAISSINEALAIGGRIAVLSYHSLEDRIVKHCFNDLAKEKTPIQIPYQLEKFAPNAKLLTSSAITASDEEIAKNSRSKSAKLRAIERIK